MNQPKSVVLSIFATGLLTFVLSLLLLGSALAGTTGKITGQVLDPDGSPLPGSNLVIEGTQRGATADAEGNYVILLVEPGTYTMTASLVGYTPRTKTQVRVNADYTTTVNFTLPPTVLEMEVLTVVAERPPVEPDKTSSKYVIDASDIEALPLIRGFNDLIELQAGVSNDGRQRIRGGDTVEAGDVTYYLDGIKIVNNDTGWDRSRYFQGFNNSAIQELTVVTGGMEAEYGNAQGGVINIVTKSGGKDLGGRLEYRFTPSTQRHWGENVYDSPLHRERMKFDDTDWVNEIDPLTGRLVHQRTNYTEVSGHFVEGNLSGPIGEKASFFASSRYNLQPATIPGPEDTAPPNSHNIGKLTFDISPNIRGTAGGFYARSRGFINGGEGTVRNMSNSGRNIFLPSGVSGGGEWIESDNLLYATLTHSLTPKMFYEVRIYRSESKRDSSGVPSLDDVRNPGPEFRDKDNWFYIRPRPSVSVRIGNQKRVGIKFDLSNQVNRGHFIKAGFDATFYDTWGSRIIKTTENSRRILFVGKAHQMGEGVTPRQYSVYAQDKMEFLGLIINVGIRGDLFDTNTPIGAWHGWPAIYTTYTRNRQAPTVDGPVIKNFSPRIGISHPITERAKLHYFFGKFYQINNFHQMFGEEWRGNEADVDVNQNGRIDPETELYNRLRTSDEYGDPREQAWEQTVQFEVGFDWNFVGDYTLSLATFHKSQNDQVNGSGFSRMNDPAGVRRPTGAGIAFRYSSLRKEFNDVRGFELGLRKKFSHNFSFSAAYNLQWESEGEGGVTFDFYLPTGEFVMSDHYAPNGADEYWEPQPDGSERLIPIREADPARARELADIADAAIAAYDPTTLQFNGIKGELMDFEDYPGMKRFLVWRQSGYGARRNSIADDRRSQGSLAFLFASPSEYGPRIRGFAPLENLNVNLVYRLVTGGPFQFRPLVGPREIKPKPMLTTVDLGVVRRFDLGERQLDFFLEVSNLFNQQDYNLSAVSSSAGNDYYQYGLDLPRPTSPTYNSFGDTLDRTRYAGAPRETFTGLRLSF